MTASDAPSAQFAHLAQLNVATLRHPLDDPRTAPFVEMLAPVNAAADGTPGFVWRLVDEGAADATELRPAGENVIVNLTVWETQEALWDFTYRSGHLEVMRRRREWFERHIEAHLVLWWVPAGRLPTVGEALERLADLRANGPSPRAFTFTSSYTAAEAAPYLRSEELQTVPSAPEASAGGARPMPTGGAAGL
jgi:heme-degrading monooxygenase HmoA